jgi:hypothetical protein
VKPISFFFGALWSVSEQEEPESTQQEPNGILCHYNEGSVFKSIPGRCNNFIGPEMDDVEKSGIISADGRLHFSPKLPDTFAFVLLFFPVKYKLQETETLNLVLSVITRASKNTFHISELGVQM